MRKTFFGYDITLAKLRGNCTWCYADLNSMTANLAMSKFIIMLGYLSIVSIGYIEPGALECFNDSMFYNTYCYTDRQYIC